MLASRRRPCLLALLVALAAALTAACDSGPADRDLRATAQAWFDAVHGEKCEALAEVDASAPPEREGPAFEGWCRGVKLALERHETDRDQGELIPDPRGYRLVRATQLGRGAFWEQIGRVDGEEGPTLIIRITFGYGEINYLTLEAGTTVYLLGAPVGTIHAIELGRGETHEIDVLEALDMRVHFQRVPNTAEGEPTHRVRRLEWIPESAEAKSVAWVF
jgi:hypothetical protein